MVESWDSWDSWGMVVVIPSKSLAGDRNPPSSAKVGLQQDLSPFFVVDESKYELLQPVFESS